MALILPKKGKGAYITQSIRQSFHKDGVWGRSPPWAFKLVNALVNSLEIQ